ncbi:MAG: hypothetical protein ACFE88_11770 [Candidatus Hermodarchaeota archaeon]
MKLLVVLVNYGTKQLKYLEKMINEFQSMKFEVDIVIHSNIALDYENVEVKVIKLDNYEHLPFTTRKTIYERRYDYDLYIYSENDHLITQKNIESFLKVTEILPKNYIAGFFQFEKHDGKAFYPAYHKNFRWDIENAFKIGDYIFAQFTNVHQASFILTRKQLNRVINNFDFLNETFKTKYSLKYRLGESFWHRFRKFYRKYLNRYYHFSRKNFILSLFNRFIENNDFLNNILNLNYSIKCRAGTDIYMYAGLKKVIPISHFDDFLIHHMPNNYKGRLGKSNNYMRKEIEKIIKKLGR